MGNDYLFALSDGGGTVPPELGIVRRLVARGHSVRVLAEDSMADEVGATGAHFLPWRTAPNRPDRSARHAFRDWDTDNPVRLARLMAEEMLAGPAPNYAADVTAEIDTRRPHLVVTSFSVPGAMIAAEAHRTPFDVLIPNIYPMPAEGLPPFGAGLRPASGPIGRRRDRFMSAATTRLLGRFVMPGLNATREHYGLGRVESMWEQVHRARRELVLTSPAFDFPARLPDTARYLGPVLDDPDWAETADPPQPEGNGPLVLVALSTTFQNQEPTLRRVLAALGEMRVRAVVTTGPALDPARLPAPPHVRVVRSAPHHRILPRAGLVITHGGHGTVIKTLAAGVPMVLLPHGRDQPDNAVRVTARGAGIRLRRNASARRLGAAARRVLDEPGYAAAAAALGERIRPKGSDVDIRELEELSGA